MPNVLLDRYFAGRGVLTEVDFSALKEGKPDALFAAWLELSEGGRNAMDSEFREIAAMSCEKGFRAILDEAEWQLRERPGEYPELVEQLAALANHYERAMATFLNYREFWKGASLFYHADTLPYWRKRKGLPLLPASVHENGRQALAASIRNYFHRTEGRGNNCVVEAFRRGELDYFFAYPEDYSQQSVEWVDGEFGLRPHNPAFEVIYVYSQKDGTLDLNFRGSHKAVEPLQGMFATEILRLPELPPDPEDTRISQTLTVHLWQSHCVGYEGPPVPQAATASWKLFGLHRFQFSSLTDSARYCCPESGLLVTRLVFRPPNRQ